LMACSSCQILNFSGFFFSSAVSVFQLYMA
jgi:hypothetical protein